MITRSLRRGSQIFGSPNTKTILVIGITLVVIWWLISPCCGSRSGGTTKMKISSSMSWDAQRSKLLKTNPPLHLKRSTGYEYENLGGPKRTIYPKIIDMFLPYGSISWELFKKNSIPEKPNQKYKKGLIVPGDEGFNYNRNKEIHRRIDKRFPEDKRLRSILDEKSDGKVTDNSWYNEQLNQGAAYDNMYPFETKNGRANAVVQSGGWSDDYFQNVAMESNTQYDAGNGMRSDSKIKDNKMKWEMLKAQNWLTPKKNRIVEVDKMGGNPHEDMKFFEYDAFEYAKEQDTMNHRNHKDGRYRAEPLPPDPFEERNARRSAMQLADSKYMRAALIAAGYDPD